VLKARQEITSTVAGRMGMAMSWWDTWLWVLNV